jgi:tripartite-type tricarboxylate transporter receptor subunit TctC
MIFMSLPSVWAQVKNNRLRPIAVSTIERSSFVPDLPTVAEAGFPDFEDYTWVGLFGPPRLPTEIVDRLNVSIANMVRQPEVRERLAAAGMEPLPGTPAEFTAYLRREVAKWRAIVKQTGVTPQ